MCAAKLKTLTYMTLQVYNGLKYRLKYIQLSKSLLSVQFASVALLKANRKQKILTQDLPDLLKVAEQADALYKEGRYVETYELLVKFKHCNDSAIIWRLCQVLHKLSSSTQFSKDVHLEMLNEGVRLIMEGLHSNQANAELHKWLAILLNSKASYEGVLAKINNAKTIKKHLVYANILNPEDKSVLYMLGYLCFQLSSLTWFQKKFLTLLYDNPPVCSYDEAFNYFLKADKLPPISISNTFMLGKLSMYMGQYFRASYYLGIAANMQPNSENDKKAVLEARKLTKRLDKYDLSKDALIFLDKSDSI